MKTYLLVLFAIFLASCTRPYFTVQGTAPHLKNGYAVMTHGSYMDLRDTIPIRDHKFSYTGKVIEPTYYSISIKGREKGSAHDYEIIRDIWLQPGSDVTFDLGALSSTQLQIKGSDVQDEYVAYRKSDKNIPAYIQAHPDSYLSSMLLFNLLRMNTEFSTANDTTLGWRLYNKLSAKIKKSASGKDARNYMAYARNMNIGKILPDFSQTDTAGNPVKLSLLRGKVVLVDFWASWCGPCRAENPVVKEAYQKYHPKGFDIIGVSLDEKKDDWLKAIKDDGLTWQHVSDLKGFDNAISRAYQIHGIPDNFLLDKNGRIVAWGLRGEELEKKLAEIL